MMSYHHSGLPAGYSKAIEGVGADYSDGFGFDEVFEVLAEVDLLAGVDWRGGLHLHFAEEFGQDVGGVVAGYGVFEPHYV